MPAGTSSTWDSATPTSRARTIAVEKLAEAARNPRNHRYSASRGIPKLRLAIANLYLRRFGVELDPDTEVVTTIGAKEGLSHLMWTLGRARATPRWCRRRATRSTSTPLFSPEPTSSRCGSDRTRTSSPT